MFCTKCGKENPDNVGYCSGCGKKVNEGQGVIDFGGIFDTLKGSGIVLFCAVAALLINTFLLGAEMFNISYTALWATKHMGFTMFEDRGILKTFAVVGYFIAVVTMVWPLLKRGYWEKKHFAMGIIMPILSLMIFVTVLVGVTGKMRSDDLLMNAAEVSFSLTTSAWVFLLVTIVTEVLVIKASGDVIGAQQYWQGKSKREHRDVQTAVSIKTETFVEDRIPTWKRVQMENEAKQKQEQEQG